MEDQVWGLHSRVQFLWGLHSGYSSYPPTFMRVRVWLKMPWSARVTAIRLMIIDKVGRQVVVWKNGRHLEQILSFPDDREPRRLLRGRGMWACKNGLYDKGFR